jgi:hypothetical protein
MEEHPVQLVVGEDLRRSRPTVFFRLLLAVPHFIWYGLWSIAVAVAAIIGWIAALATGKLPAPFHRFFAAYIRYSTHLFAYLSLVEEPYPPFSGPAGGYPFDVRLPEPAPQARWRTLLRLVLGLPAIVLAAALGGVGSAAAQTRGSRNASAGAMVTGLLVGVAFLGWFASLFSGRMPRGLRDAGAYATGYRAQTLAYLLLVTERYPSSDAGAMLAAVEPPAPHPVRLGGGPADLRRSRVTVFFRLLLAIPHLVWLVLWGIVAVFAAIAQWFVTLFAGRPARPLHAFLSRFVRYTFHVYAFLTLAENPFPGFAGEHGRYPLELELPPPGRQNRWKTAFRVILVIPASILNSALGASLAVAAMLMWFVGLAKGSVPPGLRNLAAFALRYGGQVNAYLLLLTDAYPHASPLEGAGRAEVAAPFEAAAA